jgi:glycosyltransferase involved in cell wall biosynthesis
MRYAWDLTFDYLNNSRVGKGLSGVLTRYLLHQIRQWDVISANRVDYFIANSRHTARRIWRCYRREAKVIYPPVDIDRFPYQEKKEDFYLTVSRLVSYKQIQLIIKAFNELGYPLVVIGDGPDLPMLRQLAKPNIQLLGSQPDAIVEQYMAQAKAFVYAACEDFGIALVEAQACGTPVIAYGKGGALETVLDIRQYPETGTGLFFAEQDPKSLAATVETFSEVQHQLNSESCRTQSAKFSRKIFATSYLTFLEECRLKFFS